MALSKGAKIALGCGLAAVLAAGAAVIVVGGLAWWGIGKAKEATKGMEGMVAEQEAAEKDLQKANANPFTAPEDGVVQEDRLVRFLAVRKRIHDEVYLKHKDMIEAQAQKEKADLSALAKLPLIIAELHAAKARGLAQQGMSEAEFGWLFRTVYGNLVLDGMARSGDGTTVAEADRASLKAMAEQAEQAAAVAEANPALPAEMKQQLRDAAKRAREEADRGVEMTKALDVPPANLALFQKHREEILKYTMGGLELLPF
jgi:hypothetical protein